MDWNIVFKFKSTHFRNSGNVDIPTAVPPNSIILLISLYISEICFTGGPAKYVLFGFSKRSIIELKDEITDKKEIEKIILINVPSEVYPELRKIFVFVFENSGFKDIKISNDIDFQKLYNLKKTQ